jgi:hypothetical protein
MRVLLFIAGVAALAFPAAAVAKGPDYAVLSGPGISGSIRIDGDGEGGGTSTPLGALTTYGGFFSQMFGHHPADPTSRTRPRGTLGPRYEIVYSVPTPTGRYSIESDVYPYAQPRPVTYMKPGQPFYDMHTYGGWYVGKPGLKRTILEAGLPRAGAGGTSHTWHWIGIGVLAFGTAACALAFVLRRRPQSAPLPAS